MTYNRFIEPVMLVLMIMGLLALFLNRLHMKRGIVGVRSIQFLAVVFVLPMTVILSEEGKLDSEAVAFVIGTVVGYILQFVPGDD